MKRNSVVSKLINAAVAICVVSSGFISTQVLAIPLKLNISKTEIVDPHTGHSILLLDNPSKTVEMTFLKKGISLKYTDSKGLSKEVKIHVSAIESVMHIQGTQEDVTFIYKSIDKSGLSLVSSVLHSLGSSQIETTLLLSSNRPGLVHTDFGLNEVLITNKQGSMTLLNVLSDSYLRIREQQQSDINQSIAVAPKAEAMSCRSIW